MAHVRDKLRLVLARDLKLTAFLGDFLEQARVLDGDHCLTGERLEQVDLTIREGTCGAPRDRDDADGLTFVNHWYAKDCSKLHSPICVAHARLHCLGLNVGKVDDRAIEDRASRNRSGRARRLRIQFRSFFGGTRSWIVLRGEVQKHSVVACNNGVLTSTQGTGSTHNSVEYRLNIRRSA